MQFHVEKPQHYRQLWFWPVDWKLGFQCLIPIPRVTNDFEESTHRLKSRQQRGEENANTWFQSRTTWKRTKNVYNVKWPKAGESGVWMFLLKLLTTMAHSPLSSFTDSNFKSVPSHKNCTTTRGKAANYLQQIVNRIKINPDSVHDDSCYYVSISTVPF